MIRRRKEKGSLTIDKKNLQIIHKDASTSIPESFQAWIKYNKIAACQHKKHEGQTRRNGKM